MVRPACVNVLPGRLAEGVERELALETERNLWKTADAFELLGIRALRGDQPAGHAGISDQQRGRPACAAGAGRTPQPHGAAGSHMGRQGLDPDCIARLAGRIGHACSLPIARARRARYRRGGLPGGAAGAEGRRLPGWLGAEYKPGEQGSEASLGWLAEWRAR